MAKKEEPKEATPVGVIVGRFQVNDLHEAHRQIIQQVVDTHDKVAIFLGAGPVIGDTDDPMDYETRKKMMQEAFPDISISVIFDQESDDVWSKDLDKRISEIFPFGKVTLYGGRDSFLKTYTGKHKGVELEQTIFVSGTAVRKSLSHKIMAHPAFRAGVIYSAYQKYPTSYQTVDLAVVTDSGKLVLGKKPHQNKYRFMGGFVDPTDNSLEAAAKREFKEEAGSSEVSDLEYVSSFRVDDWRYRYRRDKIMTTLFLGKHIFGTFRPGDDIEEVRLFDVEDLLKEGWILENMMAEHIPLAIHLITRLKKKGILPKEAKTPK